jgi:hypothetical protein
MEIFTIPDLSGGIAENIRPDLIKDNMAQQFLNYMVKKIGEIQASSQPIDFDSDLTEELEDKFNTKDIKKAYIWYPSFRIVDTEDPETLNMDYPFLFILYENQNDSGFFAQEELDDTQEIINERSANGSIHLCYHAISGWHIVSDIFNSYGFPDIIQTTWGVVLCDGRNNNNLKYIEINQYGELIYGDFGQHSPIRMITLSPSGNVLNNEITDNDAIDVGMGIPAGVYPQYTFTQTDKYNNQSNPAPLSMFCSDGDTPIGEMQNLWQGEVEDEKYLQSGLLSKFWKRISLDIIETYGGDGVDSQFNLSKMKYLNIYRRYIPYCESIVPWSRFVKVFTQSITPSQGLPVSIRDFKDQFPESATSVDISWENDSSIKGDLMSCDKDIIFVGNATSDIILPFTFTNICRINMNNPNPVNYAINGYAEIMIGHDEITNFDTTLPSFQHDQFRIFDMDMITPCPVQYIKLSEDRLYLLVKIPMGLISGQPHILYLAWGGEGVSDSLWREYAYGKWQELTFPQSGDLLPDARIIEMPRVRNSSHLVCITNAWVDTVSRKIPNKASRYNDGWVAGGTMTTAFLTDTSPQMGSLTSMEILKNPSLKNYFSYPLYRQTAKVDHDYAVTCPVDPEHEQWRTYRRVYKPNGIQFQYLTNNAFVTNGSFIHTLSGSCVFSKYAPNFSWHENANRYDLMNLEFNEESKSLLISVVMYPDTYAKTIDIDIASGNNYNIDFHRSVEIPSGDTDLLFNGGIYTKECCFAVGLSVDRDANYKLIVVLYLDGQVYTYQYITGTFPYDCGIDFDEDNVVPYFLSNQLHYMSPPAEGIVPVPYVKSLYSFDFIVNTNAVTEEMLQRYLLNLPIYSASRIGYDQTTDTNLNLEFDYIREDAQKPKGIVRWNSDSGRSFPDLNVFPLTNTIIALEVVPQEFLSGIDTCVLIFTTRGNHKFMAKGDMSEWYKSAYKTDNLISQNSDYILSNRESLCRIANILFYRSLAGIVKTDINLSNYEFPFRDNIEIESLTDFRCVIVYNSRDNMLIIHFWGVNPKTYMYSFSFGYMKIAGDIAMVSFMPIVYDDLYLHTDFDNNGVIDTKIRSFNGKGSKYAPSGRIWQSKKFALNYRSVRKIRIKFNTTGETVSVTVTCYSDRKYSNNALQMSYTFTAIVSQKWYVLPVSYRGLFYDVTTNADRIEYIEILTAGD